MPIINTPNNFKLWQPKEETSFNKNSTSTTDALTELQKQASLQIVDYLNSQFSIQVDPDYRKKSYLTKLAHYKKLIGPCEFLATVTTIDNHYCAIHLSQDFCLQYIDLYYGGHLKEPLSASPAPGKDSLTEFDTHALSQLTNNIAPAILELVHFNQHQKQESKLESAETATNISCYILQLHFKTKSDNFHINLVLSESIVDHYLNHSKLKAKKADTINIKNTTLELNAIIFQTKVDLSYILNLAQDELIPIETKDQITMRVNNKDLLTGTLGHINQQQAVKINTKTQEAIEQYDG